MTVTFPGPRPASNGVPSIGAVPTNCAPSAGHKIIGVAHDDHVATSLLPSPAFGPQIENVVQVDVAEEW
jgi:hypothetical protein